MGTAVANSSWGPEVTDPPHADLSAGRRITRRGILIPRHITSWLEKALRCWQRCGLGWAEREGGSSRGGLCSQEGTQRVSGA